MKVLGIISRIFNNMLRKSPEIYSLIISPRDASASAVENTMIHGVSKEKATQYES